MPLLNAPAAYSGLSTGQAAALLGVMDRHAAWDSLRRTPTGNGREAVVRLQKLQRQFDEYQSALDGYTARYRSSAVPALAPGGLDRLVKWAAVVRLVMGQAGDAACPTAVVARVHELCGRVAEAGGWEPVPRAEVTTTTDALRGLDAVIRWCDERAAEVPPAVPGL